MPRLVETSVTRLNGDSSRAKSKSRKFDLTKWFKQSTSCGTSKYNINENEIISPNVTMALSSSSSETNNQESYVGFERRLYEEEGEHKIQSPSMGRPSFVRFDNPCSIPTNPNNNNFSNSTLPTDPVANNATTSSYIIQNNKNSIDNTYDNFVVGANSDERTIQLPSQVEPSVNRALCHSHGFDRAIYHAPNQSRHPLSATYLLNPNGRHRNLANTRLHTTSNNRLGETDNTLNSSFKSCAMHISFQKSKNNRRDWRSAVDPKSGRPYYYDAVSRETQWNKPLELASESERRAIEMKEKNQRDFFSSMEANILKCLEKGEMPMTPTTCQQEDKVKPLKSRPLLKKDISRPRLIRTISSMDVELLTELTKGQSIDADFEKEGSSPQSVLMNVELESFRSLKNDPSFRFSDESRQKYERRCRDESEQGIKNIFDKPGLLALETTTIQNNKSEGKRTCPKKGEIENGPKPRFERRNSSGTLYVESSMAAPDKDATIKCVCGVYRAHLVQSIRDEVSGPSQKIRFDEYEVFNDNLSYKPKRTSCIRNTSVRKGKYRGGTTVIEESDAKIEIMNRDNNEYNVPSLEEITDFFRFAFNKAQMESDCIIMSLIYVERLLRETNGGVRPSPKNWRSILYSCMVMSSKVWDDLSMWNKDFSQVSPPGLTINLKRLNKLEIALLTCLKYNVKVQASEYAKYYFLMRSMLIRSGLVGEDIIAASPLDVEGARKLEYITTNYKVLSKPRNISQRSKSEGADNNRNEGDVNCLPSQVSSKQVNLEQVVKM